MGWKLLNSCKKLKEMGTSRTMPMILSMLLKISLCSFMCVHIRKNSAIGQTTAIERNIAVGERKMLLSRVLTR